MRPLKATLIVICLFLMSGCGPDQEAKQIRELRLAKQLDEARDLAIKTLTDSPKRKAVWQEFVRVDMDLYKEKHAKSDEKDLNYLVEAALTCIAVYQHNDKKPSDVWKSLNSQVFAFVSTECNVVLGVMQTQTKAGDYLRFLLRDKNSNYGAERTLSTTTASVDEYRVQASEVIKRMSIVVNLLNVLPEEGQGTKEVLIKQMANSMSAWSSSLDLEPSLKENVYMKYKTAVETAIQNTQEDFSAEGYLQIDTITQNKVM